MEDQEGPSLSSQPITTAGPPDFEANAVPDQKLSAYDEDAALSVSTLLSLHTCNGRIGATGMCLGGHLAYRCALDKRVGAAVCYFATDIHSHSLGEGEKDDSLERTGDIEGELVMVCVWGFKRVFLSEDGRGLKCV